MGIPGGEIWVQFQENFLIAAAIQQRNGLSCEVVSPPSLLQVKQKLLFIDQGLWVWDCKVGYFACDNL